VRRHVREIARHATGTAVFGLVEQRFTAIRSETIAVLVLTETHDAFAASLAAHRRCIRKPGAVDTAAATVVGHVDRLLATIGDEQIAIGELADALGDRT
jgi:hypothetical protein